MAKADNPKSDKLKDVHKRALRRFDEIAIPQQEMRRQSLEARRFIAIPGAQWEGEWGEQFENSIKVEIPKIGRRIRKIETDYRENRIVPDFRPDGGRGDQETADTLDAIHRADSYRFKAQQARDNAFTEAVAGGFGAYRLANVLDDEEDPENDDQRINPARLIADADQHVFFDIQSRLYDKSDARFAYVLIPFTRDAFVDEYGEECAEWPQGVSRPQFDWYRPKLCYAAEYYEVERKASTLYIFTQTLTGDEERYWDDEVAPEDLSDRQSGGWHVRTQKRNRKRVRKYIITGAKVLEDLGHVAGDNIPIVPVYGQRFFVDGMERWKGEVQDRMDAQRLYNSNVSRLAEINALSPREIPIFAPEQMEGGLGEKWGRAHIDRLAYLLANPLTDPATGALLNGGGPLGYVKPPDVPQVTAALLHLTNGDLTEEDRDGADTVKANTSAEAMDIAAARVDAKSGIYLDNMRQSVEREGVIYFGMAKEVYPPNGRVVDTMSEDGDDGTAVMGEEYATEKGEHRIRNDFSRGRYKCIVSVTEETATRRDKTVRSMLSTAEAAVAAQDMELAQICLRTAVYNQDGEGMSEIKAWARKGLVQMGAVEPNEEEKAAMAEAAQQPDATTMLAESQSKALEASAVKDVALAGKAEADTIKSRADAAKTLSDIGAPANDAVATPRILRGNQLP